jgi:hypothetical protein
MYNYCKYWFQEKQWELYVGVTIVLILCIFFYNTIRGKKGTWSTRFENNNLLLFSSHDSGESCSEFKNESKGELKCRQFLNKYFNKPFIKVRNLYNPVTHQYLELDCYNEDLKLAVEYQGQQHYKHVPYFHKNFESFRNQQYRDELKRIFCRDLGITLVEVPYTVKDIDGYLWSKLQHF